MEMWITLAGIIITGAFSTIGAIINSNARAEVMEQKFTDMFTAFDKEQSEIKERLNELSETDSCCVLLKDDVAQIKENITDMSAAINQLKAETTQANMVNMKINTMELRHQINEGYRVFKELGYIDQKSKDSLFGLGDVYHNDCHGNSYVQDELDYLRTLKVV